MTHDSVRHDSNPLHGETAADRTGDTRVHSNECTSPPARAVRARCQLDFAPASHERWCVCLQESLRGRRSPRGRG
eukprot:5773973-Prymnesium_polylepis.2